MEVRVDVLLFLLVRLDVLVEIELSGEDLGEALEGTDVVVARCAWLVTAWACGREPTRDCKTSSSRARDDSSCCSLHRVLILLVLNLLVL